MSILYFTEEEKYSIGKTWVPDDKIFIFEWTKP